MYEITIYYSTESWSGWENDSFSYHSKNAMEEDLKEIMTKYFEKYYNVEITIKEKK